MRERGDASNVAVETEASDANCGVLGFRWDSYTTPAGKSQVYVQEAFWMGP